VRTFFETANFPTIAAILLVLLLDSLARAVAFRSVANAAMALSFAVLSGGDLPGTTNSPGGFGAGGRHILQDHNFGNRRTLTMGIENRLLCQGSYIQISCNCGYGLILCSADRRGFARNHQFRELVALAEISSSI
jgi:hypothetical protein